MKYDFDTIISRRGTNSYKWDIPEEENVLPMWVADMDFRTACLLYTSIRVPIKLVSLTLFKELVITPKFIPIVINLSQ